MDVLTDYLQRLLSSCSDELRLEPDRNPYLVSGDNRTTDVAHVPLKGTQISTMVFPLIPPEVKTTLPGSDEIEFVLPHNLGNFNFNVAKSPAGFVVTIRPMLNDIGTQPEAAKSLPAEPPSLPEPAGYEPSADPEPAPAEVATAYSSPVFEPTPVTDIVAPADSPAAPVFSSVTYEIESSSAEFEKVSSLEVDERAVPELIFEEKETAQEYVPSSGPEIEVVSVNDPEYQTVFSDTAPEAPLTRRDYMNEPEYVPSSTPELQFETPAAPNYTPPSPLEVQNVPPPVANYMPPPPAYATPQQPEAAFVPATANPMMNQRMDDYFNLMAEIGASDLHLSVSMPPMVRKDGKIKPLTEGDAPITPEEMQQLLTSIMPPKNQEEFARRNDTDFAYEIPGLARFRSNIFRDRKGMGAVFRIIPTKMTTAAQLGLSDAILGLTHLSKGLVVVTGPTGSGKSTTLCAMVNEINMTREDHIITIEDPVEFVHENIKCLVNQREVHNHTDSFKDALRAALREDPDILLVGEMRDLETISIAIETAETGHLVFGTLHTTTAASTVDRIIDQFPADRQQQIRVMLSESLKGVIAQTLLPKKGGGRVAALEVLIVTPAISNLIREGKTFQIPSAMQTGKNHGMVMLNDALFEHVKNGLVEPRDAYIKAVDKAGFETLLQRGGFKL